MITTRIQQLHHRRKKGNIDIAQALPLRANRIRNGTVTVMIMFVTNLLWFHHAIDVFSGTNKSKFKRNPSLQGSFQLLLGNHSLTKFNISDSKTWLLSERKHPIITEVIPPLINKIYLQRDGQFMDNDTITPSLKEAQDSWTKMNPGYKVRRFNLITAREYLRVYFQPTFMWAFDCILSFSGKADLFRLAVVYREGGWYSDWKQKCLKANLLAEISNKTDFFAIQDNGNDYSKKHHCVQTAFFGATPQHPFIAKALEVILKHVRGNYYGNFVLDTTGPCAFARGIEEAKEQYGFDDEKYDTSDYEFVLESPRTFFKKDDEKIIQHKCDSCGYDQDWKLGNSYVKKWDQKNFYCDDAAAIFE